MTTDNKNQKPRNGSVALGGILIILGGIFLLGQLFDIDVGRYAWPFFIIVPGVLLFIFGLATGGSAGERLTIAGSIVTMTGALLLYQNTFNHFQSWAYGWALVAPTSIGLGQMIFGALKDQPHSVQAGKRLAAIGVSIFLIGAIFFELIIGISGFGVGRLGNYVWPILLIGLGIFVILRNWWPGSAARPTSTIAAPTSAEATDPAQKLAQLKEMLDEGLITDADYETKKAEILAEDEK